MPPFLLIRRLVKLWAAGSSWPSGLDEAALGEGLSLRVLDGEGDPGLVHVALLGHVGVGDALVLDDDGDGDALAGVEREGILSEWGDEAGLGAFWRARFDCEDVDVEDVVLQEGGHALHLLVEVIVLRDDRVGAQPAMRGELAVLGAGVGQGDESLALHVAGLAGGDDVLLVEGKRRLPWRRRRSATRHRARWRAATCSR